MNLKTMADANSESAPFSHIVVYDYARLSRSAEEFQESKNRLEAHSIRLISVMQGEVEDPHPILSELLTLNQ